MLGIAIKEELQLTNFKTIITDYESEQGEIPKMYREPRGSIYHPHRKETITLGMLMVERYERPPWAFNKLLYIEKEGANEALKEVSWGERHDCTIMSSKGFSTRAARDLDRQDRRARRTCQRCSARQMPTPTAA